MMTSRIVKVIRYTLTHLQYLQQYKKSKHKIMGCGTVCGGSSSVAESSKQAQTQFLSLFKQIMPNQYLYPVKAIAKFAKQMQVNPHRYQLILTQKLQTKFPVSVGVMQKWKIILFGLDCDRPAYLNCLGYPDNAMKTKPSAQKQLNGQIANSKQAGAQPNIQNVELIQHKAFTQIEKDIERTFPGIEFEKKIFSAVLKRISNHFPVMGYTQGINFIVGYLLIIGYSQNDAFWLFTHMAINRRYMILGLYEDGFPLINVYTCIFRNILKRTNQKLYKHLYQSIIMFQQSAWVFKWFMTCYLSSFPIQMGQYVWDLVLSTGGIGLVKFAISLVTKLEKQLYVFDDACDITEFFSSFKEIQIFNKYLSIKDVVKSAYKVKIQRQDLNELQQVRTQRGGNNFYAQYFLFKFQQQIYESSATPKKSEPENQNIVPQSGQPDVLKNAKQQLHQTNPILFKKLSARRSTQLLNQWYDKLLRQRNQFKEKQMQKKRHPYASILNLNQILNQNHITAKNSNQKLLQSQQKQGGSENKSNLKNRYVNKKTLTNVRQFQLSQHEQQLNDDINSRGIQQKSNTQQSNQNQNQFALPDQNKRITINIQQPDQTRKPSYKSRSSLKQSTQNSNSHSNKQFYKNSKLSLQKYGSLQIIQEQIRRIEEKEYRNPREKDIISNIILENQEFGTSPTNKITAESGNQKSNANGKLKSRHISKKNNLVWLEEDQQLEKQEIKDKIKVLEDQFFYIPQDIRFKRKNVKYQSDDALSNFINNKNAGKNTNMQIGNKNRQQINKQVYKNTYLLPQYPIDNQRTDRNSNLNNSRLAKAGNSVISSNMSVSNASRSSGSSYRTTHKQSSIKTNMNNKITTTHTHVYTRQCKCVVKNKTEENANNVVGVLPSKKSEIALQLQIKQQIHITSSQIDKNDTIFMQQQNFQNNSIDNQQFHDHQQSVDQIKNPRKRLNTYQDWMVNSQGPRLKPTMDHQHQHDEKNLGNSHAKQASELGTEVEIVQGDHVFKKKNRVNNCIHTNTSNSHNSHNSNSIKQIGCIVHEYQPRNTYDHKISYNCNIEEISQSLSRGIPTPVLAYAEEDSCQSFVIGSISARKSEIGDIQSVR